MGNSVILFVTMFLPIAITHAWLSVGQAPKMLAHTFTKGLKSEYKVDANLQIEFKPKGLSVFMPEDDEIKYTFFTNTLSVDNGVATVRYSRPSMTEIGSATPDADPKPVTEVTNELALLKMSPINEVLDVKDLTPKKKKPANSGDSQRTPWQQKLMVAGTSIKARQDLLSELIGPFIGDLERLSVYIGGVDSSLDLEPRLNLSAVAVGDTWKRTVSYQPQKLASKTGKMVVQRLDMTYTYKGQTTVANKPALLIHAAISLDTDLGAYINDLFGAKPENTGLKGIPAKMDIQIDFFLDAKTLQTTSAKLKSEGGFSIMATSSSTPVEQYKIHGDNKLVLVSNKIVAESPEKK